MAKAGGEAQRWEAEADDGWRRMAQAELEGGGIRRRPEAGAKADGGGRRLR